MNTRELEKLARTLAAQRLDPEYIRHYLMETFQVDSAMVDHAFERVGMGKKKGIGSAVRATERKKL